MAALGEWGLRNRATSPPLRVPAELVADGGPALWELARAIKRLPDHGYPINHGTDHGVTVSVYLANPDGNGIELFYDRPRAEWFDARGHAIIKVEPLDPNDLLPTPTTAD
jgi:catechol 2,3-dioxygenase